MTAIGPRYSGMLSKILKAYRPSRGYHFSLLNFHVSTL